jgi:glycogen debranching enzyme
LSRAGEPDTFRLMEPPPEPKVLYPEPMLQSDESLAIIRGTTFFAATLQGDVTPSGAPQVGLFCDDTRFLSLLELRVNGQEPIVLSSTTMGADMARVELTVRGGSVSGENLDLPVNTVYVHREQLLDHDRLYDVLEIQSFHSAEVRLTIELLFAADFVDIFQVRGLLRGKSGRYFCPEVSDSHVRLQYEGLDKRSRSTELFFTPQPQVLEEKRALWELRLPPHAIDRIATTITMDVSASPEQVERPPAASRQESLEEARSRSVVRHGDWAANCTRLRSDNQIFDVMLETASEDFYALRMPEKRGTAVAAGVPWFAALFGRDSLLSSYETLLLDPELARGTLRVLASYQGQTKNDERDEDPGKILHERRSGEMTATNEVAFGRSYGSVDATPLFLILAHEYFRWTGDHALLHELKEPLKAATNWILRYGDLDGDGLIEYCRRNPKGLFNQGWKDSGDANRHSDGSIAEPPIALIEVQGYAVRALAGVSEILELLTEHELGVHAKERSDQLQHLIEERFWLEDRTYYAMALDRNKSPLRVDGSNPGHLLFSSAISAQRGRQVTERLLDKGLFCGWGIRTLSCAEGSFNPMSYHCGSVWPHDNAIIGYGMARYGLHREASIVFQALYDTALQFREYRLPELFCGIERQFKSEPVHYPVSCSPQAWAAGAPFLLLTGLLGLQPNADRGELAIVDPHLPPFLHALRVENLRIGSSRIALDFRREGERTHCNVVDVQGKELKISIVLPSGDRSA